MGFGSRKRLAGLAYSAPPDLLAGFWKGKGLQKREEKGLGRGKWRGKKGSGRNEEGMKERGEERKGRSNPSRTKILATDL